MYLKQDVLGSPTLQPIEKDLKSMLLGIRSYFFALVKGIN